MSSCFHCGSSLHDPEHKKHLSVREAQVAALVIEGLSNENVGKILFITAKTVKYHTTSIYKKMGVKKRSQLINGYYTERLEHDGMRLISAFISKRNGGDVNG